MVVAVVPASRRVSFLFKCTLSYYLKGIIFFMCLCVGEFKLLWVGGLREEMRVSEPLEFQAVGSPSNVGAGN